MRFARLLTVGLALVMTASGCTSEPSLKDAAAELQKDTQRLETDDVFKNPLMNLRIVQRPDKDLPCGGIRLSECCGQQLTKNVPTNHWTPVSTKLRGLWKTLSLRSWGTGWSMTSVR